MRRERSHAVLACLAILVALSCAKEPPPIRAESPVRTQPLAVPGAAPSASAQASAVSQDTPAPAPATSSLDAPPQVPRAGEIPCHGKTCTAGKEICLNVFSPDAACVPKGTPHQDVSYVECDDSGDCAEGQRCCYGDMAYHFSYCSSKPCDIGQRCKPGDACGTRMTCAPGSSFYECTEANPQARCGGSTCSGDKPVCLVRGGKMECASRREAFPPDAGFYMPAAGDGALQCTGPKDCGSGRACCLGGPSSQLSSCNGSCTANLNVLCDSDADCRGPSALARCGSPSSHGKCVAPSAPPEGSLQVKLPPGVRVCTCEP